jgi:mRNA interferase MazF
MSCFRSDVVLLPIPFSDLTSRKVRPAVVVGKNGIDLFLVPISSQLHQTTAALRDWRTAGLNVPCGIKPQIATVEERLIVKKVGSLSPFDQQSVTVCLRRWLDL